MEVLMERLPRILLKVGAGQVDDFLVSLVAVTDLQLYLAPDHHRQVHLADLVAFRQVRIKVVFAGKYRFLRDFGADRQAETDGALDGLPVQHRQNTRQGKVDRTGLRVRCRAESGRRTRKNLGDCRQLRVRLDADYHFPLSHSFIRSETTS